MTSIVHRVPAILAVMLLGTLLSGCGYNTIPTLEEQAKARWSDVQNQYQRRADLIPNLVATVQGYAKQEKDVLTAVVEARAVPCAEARHPVGGHIGARDAAARQNFTCGGVCAPSLAANSAIGLLERKKVAAHRMPGNVLSSVLYSRTASM